MLVVSFIESIVYCVRHGNSESSVDPEPNKQLTIVTGDVRKIARMFWVQLTRLILRSRLPRF